MKIRKSDIGRVCLVEYNDIGTVEGMIVEVDSETNDAAVFVFADRILDRHVSFNQIVETGHRITSHNILESSMA